jgi:hypothetical protein
MSDIGRLNEKPLHASLKEWCAEPGDRFEERVGRYVIDIVREDLLLEIQTGSFASIKSKLEALVATHRVRLIYPIAQEKWIVKRPARARGEVTRRKSPKRGRLEDLFAAMVSFPRLLADPNFSLEILLIREEELRRYDGKRRWRRKGWATEERRLLEVVDRRLFEAPADWRALLPETLAESFTTSDIEGALGIPRQLAQRMAYCLREAEVITRIGKHGRANLYRLAGGGRP